MIVCIDPGASGAIAILSDNGEVSVHPFAGKDPHTVIEAAINPVDWEEPQRRCYIEKNPGNPGHGINGMAKLKEMIDLTRGAFRAWEIPLIEVPTRKWAVVVPGLSTITAPKKSTAAQKAAAYKARKLKANVWAGHRFPRVSCSSPSGKVTADCGDALCMLAWAEGEAR